METWGAPKFPPELRLRSTEPNFILLGSPIGDTHFCSSHVDQLRLSNKKLLDSLSKLEDPQVALHLLRTCSSFCKFVYIARTTPPSLVADSLALCDQDIAKCLEKLAAIELTSKALCQAQLCLTMGGLGLRSLQKHCSAAFIASHIQALPDLLTQHLRSAFLLYSSAVGLLSPMGEDEISSVMTSSTTQRTLSTRIDRSDRASLFADSLLADQIRLTSLTAQRTASWLVALPCRGPVDLTLTPDEMQVALKHRLGLPLSQPDDTCPLCDDETELDVLGHHHITCSTGGFVTVRHNRLRDCLFQFCSRAGLGPLREFGAERVTVLVQISPAQPISSSPVGRWPSLLPLTSSLSRR